MTLPSPSLRLQALSRQFPGVWGEVDRLRAMQGKGLDPWPPWCFMPMEGAHALASVYQKAFPGGDWLETAGLIARISALAAWRATQGIYRWDPSLYPAVVETDIRGPLPREVLLHLPEWCPYIETPGMDFLGVPSPGFWVHMEHDVNDGRQELRFLVDREDQGEMALMLHLLPGATLEDALDAALGEAVAQHKGPMMLPPTSPLLEELSPRLALALYLCSRNRDLVGPNGQDSPTLPSPMKIKRDAYPRLFPPPAPVPWLLGSRVGAQLRVAQASRDEPRGGTHARPGPHVRRAHYHTYWVGPKTEPRAELRWLSPILVGAVEGLIPAVRGVKEEK